MRIGDEQLVDEILVLDLRRRAAAPAALLRLVGIDRLRLGVAPVRQRYDDFLARDQILDTEIRLVLHDLGAAIVAECVADFLEFVANDLKQLVGVGQNTRKLFNFIQ